MRLGVMCSGNGTNFQNIVTNPVCNTNEVVIMIHNTKQCGAMARAAKWGIPYVRVPHKDEEKMIELFKVWRVDLDFQLVSFPIYPNNNITCQQ